MFNTRWKVARCVSRALAGHRNRLLLGTDVRCMLQLRSWRVSFELLISFLHVLQTEHFQRTLAFGFLFY